MSRRPTPPHLTVSGAVAIVLELARRGTVDAQALPKEHARQVAAIQIVEALYPGSR